MMSDVNCPYCGHGQEINHDDGYGYDEGEDHEQNCVSCGKGFKFQTSISYFYEVFCMDDCDHEMEQSIFEEHKDLFSCTKCDHYEVRRDL